MVPIGRKRETFPPEGNRTARCAAPMSQTPRVCVRPRSIIISQGPRMKGQTNLEVSIIKGLLFLARNWLAAQGYASVVSAA